MTYINPVFAAIEYSQEDLLRKMTDRKGGKNKLNKSMLSTRYNDVDDGYFSTWMAVALNNLWSLICH